MLAHENETLNLEYFTRETAKNTIDDWRYEMRREIQEVLVGTSASRVLRLTNSSMSR